MHLETAFNAVDLLHLGLKHNVNTESSAMLHKPLDQIRIKAVKRAGAAVQDNDLSTGARGNVSELERDVAAADKNDPCRQVGELQKLIARYQVFGAGDRQGRRPRAGRHHDVPGLQHIVADANTRWPD